MPLDTRTDWDAALRLEDARLARYGRPASVLIVSLEPAGDGSEDRFAARVGEAIRAHARETDRVARVGPGRFHVLLPETVEAEASALAERVREACAEMVAGQPAFDLEIRAVAASPARGGTLADALRRASLRLAE
ncbi:MAG TPA: diguanylate cyclase [Candidatus Saccharimonadales bacterium]|nr:diguanylate cyclase [Candidatus Saccharimonadales bacterium]